MRRKCGGVDLGIQVVGHPIGNEYFFGKRSAYDAMQECSHCGLGALKFGDLCMIDSKDHGGFKGNVVGGSALFETKPNVPNESAHGHLPERDRLSGGVGSHYRDAPCFDDQQLVSRIADPQKSVSFGVARPTHSLHESIEECSGFICAKRVVEGWSRGAFGCFTKKPVFAKPQCRVDSIERYQRRRSWSIGTSPVETLLFETLLIETEALLIETVPILTPLTETGPVETLLVDTPPIATLPVKTVPVKTMPVETMIGTSHFSVLGLHSASSENRTYRRAGSG
jgi:hypothetical protein